MHRPVRWDEWIHMSSPRIAPFRSRTQHTSASLTSSPAPTTPVAGAPVTGADDIRTLLPHIAELINIISPMANRASILSSEV